jgi:hypothetical protein
MSHKFTLAIVGGLGLVLSAGEASALAVVNTTSSTDLTGALVANPSNFSSISATYVQGDDAQVGTYTGFTSPPVTIGNGVVMSTGNAIDTVGPYAGTVSTALGGGSTPEIDAYAPGHIDNWDTSEDTAVLQLDFNLANPSAIKFSFIFGSVEFPEFTSEFTDSFLVFLDGTQITFDASDNPVQVGSSFASSLRTDDTNTIFTGVGAGGDEEHGLLDVLTTISGELTAGAHVLLFEVSDTNDQNLDSAVFLTGFDTTIPNPGGPVTIPDEPGTPSAPEPGTLALLGLGLAAFGALRRRLG